MICLTGLQWKAVPHAEMKVGFLVGGALMVAITGCPARWSPLNRAGPQESEEKLPALCGIERPDMPMGEAGNGGHAYSRRRRHGTPPQPDHRQTSNGGAKEYDPEPVGPAHLVRWNRPACSPRVEPGD